MNNVKLKIKNIYKILKFMTQQYIWFDSDFNAKIN